MRELIVCTAGLFTAIDTLAAQKTTAAFESLAGLVIAHFADEEKVKTLPAAHLVCATCCCTRTQLTLA